jgi:energy-converting hydrogenase Eha subunit F
VFHFKYFRQIFFKKALPPELVRARQLISALDRGGIPLNPAKVNAIARDLGLEVSTRAPMEETIVRIRACLKRA